MANEQINDLDLLILANEGEIPTSVTKPTLMAIKGDGGGGGFPQEYPAPETLQPNISYWIEPSANMTFALAPPLAGQLSHYHLIWINDNGSYVPSFTGPAGSAFSWSILCGPPPTSTTAGAVLEFSIVYADTLMIGLWAKVNPV